MNFETISVTASGVMLAVSLVLLFWRFLRGPSDADRVLAIDLAAVTAASGMIVGMMSGDAYVYLDVILLLGSVLFFSTIAFSRALEVRNAKQRKDRSS